MTDRNDKRIPPPVFFFPGLRWGMGKRDRGGRKLVKWFFVQIAGMFRVRMIVHGRNTESVCGGTIVHDKIS